MRKTIFITLAVSILASVSAAAVQDNALLLQPRPRDFFQEVKYLEAPAGINVLLEWARPPALQEKVEKKMTPYLLPAPQSETPRLLGSFDVFSSAILTENQLGAGTTLTIKAAGSGNSFSYIMDPETVIDLRYHKYDVKTSGPGVDDTDDFSVKQLGVRRVVQVPFIEDYFRGPEILAEYRFISDKIDSAHYISGTANRPLNENLTATLGAEYIDSGTGGRALGIVAGARYVLTPDLQAFAMYSGADPGKYVYNYHMLQSVSGVGSIYCVDCDDEAMNAGLTYQLGSNLALNLFGFDMLDMSVTSGSLSYVVKQ